MRGVVAPYAAAAPPYSWWITMIPSLGFLFSNFPNFVATSCKKFYGVLVLFNFMLFN